MQPYLPQTLPLAELDYARLIRKIGPANAALARYDGLLQSVDLYQRMKQKIAELTRSHHADKVLDALFDRPIFHANDFAVRTGIPRQSAARLLGVLKEASVLRVMRPAGGNQPAVLAFNQLLDYAEGKRALKPDVEPGD